MREPLRLEDFNSIKVRLKRWRRGNSQRASIYISIP